MISITVLERGIEILRAFEIKHDAFSICDPGEAFSICDLGLIIEVKLPIVDWSTEHRLLQDLGWEKVDDRTWQLGAVAETDHYLANLRGGN